MKSVLELTHLPDYTMPGIKTLLKGGNEANGKDKKKEKKSKRAAKIAGLNKFLRIYYARVYKQKERSQIVVGQPGLYEIYKTTAIFRYAE